MAKEQQRQIAYTLYVEQCFTAKEIADKLSVTPKTVGEWVEKGNWKELRNAKQSSSDKLIKNYKELMNLLVEKRLTAEKKQGKKNDKENEDYKGLLDEISKLGAVMDRLQKDGKPSLRIHILVIEKFMNALHQHNSKLFMDLIEFQKQYLPLLAEELK